MSECRYIPLESRASALIAKGVRAWQQIQRLAMEQDDLVNSVVLDGQELWLPHHETDGALYRVTLRITAHVSGADATAPLSALLRELEAGATDAEGELRIAAEIR